MDDTPYNTEAYSGWSILIRALHAKTIDCLVYVNALSLCIKKKNQNFLKKTDNFALGFEMNLENG